MNHVNYTKLKLNGTLLRRLRERYIAFDTETTGLDADYNRIIEVGAVLFEDGKPVKSYGSLMHSVNFVPYEARMVNHITDSMVRSAPAPEKVYGELYQFFGDAMRGDTVIVGHNATFDMKFLAAEMNRQRRAAEFVYADTCALSRTVMPYLYSHTQDSVARQLGIQNQMSHRAETDAETCGKIMAKMLPMLERNEKIREAEEKRAAKRQKFEPIGENRALCEALARRAAAEGLTDEYLCFQQSGKMIHVRSAVPLFSINRSCKKPYIVAERAYLTHMIPEDVSPEDVFLPCTDVEARLYRDAVRLPAGEEMNQKAEELLVAALRDHLESRSAMLEDAALRWNLLRDMELYWQL